MHWPHVLVVKQLQGELFPVKEYIPVLASETWLQGDHWIQMTKRLVWVCLVPVKQERSDKFKTRFCFQLHRFTLRALVCIKGNKYADFWQVKSRIFSYYFLVFYFTINGTLNFLIQVILKSWKKEIAQIVTNQIRIQFSYSSFHSTAMYAETVQRSHLTL